MIYTVRKKAKHYVIYSMNFQKYLQNDFNRTLEINLDLKDVMCLNFYKQTDVNSFMSIITN